MPKITAETVIAAPLETVWRLAQDVEKLPDFIPDLTSVKVLERAQTSADTIRTVSDWTARIKQFNRNVHWIEEDIWNEEKKVCHFWQIRGDYDDYRGEWKFENVDDKSTRVLLDIEYSFNIPLLGPLIQKVAHKLMQNSSDTMLACLKTEAEKP